MNWAVQYPSWSILSGPQRPLAFDPPPPAMVLAAALLQRTAAFQANAPSGTGLEWLTIVSLLLPAVLLVFLVYWGAQETV